MGANLTVRIAVIMFPLISVSIFINKLGDNSSLILPYRLWLLTSLLAALLHASGLIHRRHMARIITIPFFFEMLLFKLSFLQLRSSFEPSPDYLATATDIGLLLLLGGCVLHIFGFYEMPDHLH